MDIPTTDTPQPKPRGRPKGCLNKTVPKPKIKKMLSKNEQLRKDIRTRADLILSLASPNQSTKDILEQTTRDVVEAAPQIGAALVKWCLCDDGKVAVRAIEIASRMIGLGPVSTESRVTRDMLEQGAQVAATAALAELSSIRDYIRWKTTTTIDVTPQPHIPDKEPGSDKM